MVKTVVLVLALAACQVIAPQAQGSDPNQGREQQGAGLPLTTRVIQSGHSLTDPLFTPLHGMLRVSGVRGAVMDKSTIPGSPMSWRWDNEPGYGLPDAKSDIGDYELLVITEGVSMAVTLDSHSSDEYALRWFNNSWSRGNHGRGAQTILYASWIWVDSGPDFVSHPYDPDHPEDKIPFRQRLELEMARWEQVADYVNANRPAGSPPMRIIPGPLIMAAAYDGIAAGQAPGLRRIEDLFADTIHVNDLGAYLIALAHYAVIYGRDPRGLPANVGLAQSPSQATADWMQEIVWQVVRGYERSWGAR